MSVYTPVTAEELEAWLTRYAAGGLVLQSGIATGIENTNYFVTTTKGRFVLTLYERLPAEELPFYLNLMAHLARAGVECPAPIPDRTGTLFSTLNGKPASLVVRVDGEPVLAPDVRPLRSGRRRTRATACRVVHLPGPPHQPARPVLVATGGPRRPSVRQPGPE